MALHVHVHVSHENDQDIVRLLTQLTERILKMPTLAEVKQAVADKAAEVTAAIQTAITTETTQIAAQIQALKDQIAAGATISSADLDDILAPVQGIGTAVSTAVDAISTGDGA